ncbi:MAG: HAD family phosphatase [Tissierellia bacterium]|nr:HAD family phosphatase [Tissierellia bacterium]
MKKPIHVFDLDGTILDSMPMWRNLAKNFLLSQGVNPPDNILDRLLTLTLKQSAVLFKNDFLPKLSADEINDMMMDYVRHQYANNIIAKPGALEYMKEVANRNIYVILATATPEEQAIAIVDRFNLPIDELITVDKVGIQKNDPSFFSKIGNNLVVYEDALHAIQSAIVSGAYVVAIDEPARADKELILPLVNEYWYDWLDKEVPKSYASQKE